MKKTFKLQDLDCANCAAKMEQAVRKIEGVESAQISFLSQKFTLCAPDDAFDAIVAEAIRVCKKIEPDCVIVL
ncbi:MAG: cation transporter [Christensenellaceae bacterium]|jgi:copper chaperone CopZ|nr:cation transporter [Christensenellaceae bacterium]